MAEIHSLHVQEVSWLDKLHQGQAYLRNIQSGLHSLQNRLAGVGMDKLAREVAALHTAVVEAHDILNSGISDAVVKQINQSFTASGNLFRGIAAGAALNSKTPQEREGLVRLAGAIPHAE